MGGGDKALLRIGGVTILDRVLERLRPQCSGIILNANGDPRRFASTGLPVVADDVPGFAGPLAGILAGLDWAAAHAPDMAWIGSVPGDCPFLPRDLIARLHAARTEAGHAAGLRQIRRLAASGGRAMAGRFARRPAPRLGRGGFAENRDLDRAVMGWPWPNGRTPRSTPSSTSTPPRTRRGPRRLRRSMRKHSPRLSTHLISSDPGP